MPPRGYRYRRTHCPRGHLFDRANTYIRKDNGRQICRTCARERQRERRHRLRCPVCAGRGEVLHRNPAGHLSTTLVPCPLCEGSADRRTPPA